MIPAKHTYLLALPKWFAPMAALPVQTVDVDPMAGVTQMIFRQIGMTRSNAHESTGPLPQEDEPSAPSQNGIWHIAIMDNASCPSLKGGMTTASQSMSAIAALVLRGFEIGCDDGRAVNRDDARLRAPSGPDHHRTALGLRQLLHCR